MTPREIANLIHEAEGRHSQDNDGGYGLVEDLVQTKQLLGAADQERLRDELLRILAGGTGMRGVALEALVQGWGSGVVTDLAALIDRSVLSGEMEHGLLMALLRLRYIGIRDQVKENVRKRMAAGDLTLIPLLAALCRIDADGCIDLASTYFAATIRNGDERRLRGYIPAVVGHFVATSDALVAQLIKQMAAIDSAASKTLCGLVFTYLERPYVVAELGPARISAIKESTLR